MKRAIVFIFSILILLIPPFLQSADVAEKPVLAVLNLAGRNVQTQDALIITDFVQEAFFRTGKYEIVERTQVEKLLKEQAYQSEVCDISCAVNIGKQLAANKVVIGTVGKLGHSYTLSLKIIDIGSNKIEKMDSIRAKCNIGDLPDYVNDLAQSLLGEFEIIEGKDGKSIFNKAIKQLGDPQKILNAKTIHFKEYGIVSVKNKKKQYISDSIVKFPDKLISHFKFNNMKYTIILNGEKAVLKRSKKTIILPKLEKEHFKRYIIRHPIYIYQNIEKYKIEYLGIRESEFQESYILSMNKLGYNFYFYVDPKTMKIIEVEYEDKLLNETINIIFSDYRLIDGINCPLSSYAKSGSDFRSESTIKFIKFNVNPKKNIFRIK